MAQSYTRQSTFADGDTITASLFNNEYNQLINTFAYSAVDVGATGHRHDGSSAQGGNIHTIGDLDFFNKIVVDSTNNRWGVFVQVGAGAVEQIRIQDGGIVPVTTNDIDLGTASLQFKDIFIDGTANIDSLVLTSGSTVTTILDEDDLVSNSATALVTQQSVKAYIDAQVTAQDLDIVGDTGTDSIDLDSETITFTGGTGITSVVTTGVVTHNIDSTVTTLTGVQTLTNKTLTSPDINGGTVDAADITVGVGKTLDVSAGTLTLADNQISGDKVEGGTIAATTITALTFGSLNDGAIIIDGWADEDNMVSNSATLVPTQQSVKAYVDAQVTAQDLDLTDGTTTIAIDLDSEALSVLGGTGITSTASGNGVTLAIDSTVTTLTGIQTLTNKTLTSPDINGGTVDGTVIGATTPAAVTTTALVATTADINAGTIDATVIGGTTAAAGSFTTIGATGNITVGGTVDGRDVATDGTKLDGIEVAATADQTDAEIRAAVEAAIDSNVFTDADHSKLNAIEAGATADQTDAEIRAAVEAAIDSNVFTDADHTKLNAIEALADVTDTVNVTAAGALMDSELTDIVAVKALDQGVATTDSPTFVNMTMTGTGSVKVPAGTTGERDGVPVNGMFRYNSTNEQFEGYQNSEWGSIGGGGGSNTFTTDTFVGDGITTDYALSQVINSEDNLMVFIAGVFQQQSAYTIATASGTTTLTFSTAPVNTREIVIYSIAGAVSGTNLNVDSMTGDGTTVAMTLSITPVNENNTQVFIDGVYQSKSNYSISGTTLTFSTAPPNGTAVEVMTMNQTEINVPVDGTVTSAKLDTNIAIAGTLGVGGAATFSGDVGIGGAPLANNQLLLTDAGTYSQFHMQNSTSGSGASDGFRILMDGVNTTITNHETGYMAFETQNTERLRIDSAGAATFSGNVNSTAAGENLFSNVGNVSLAVQSSATDKISIGVEQGVGGTFVASGGALKFRVGGYTAAFDKAQIDPSGNLLVGKSTATYTTTGHWINGSTGQLFTTSLNGYAAQFMRNGTDGILLHFYNDGVSSGSISVAGATSSFVGTSDPRVKTHFSPITDALALIEQTVENGWLGSYAYLSRPGVQHYGYNAHELIDNQPQLGGVEGEGPRNMEIGAEYEPAFVDEDGNEIAPAKKVTPAGVDPRHRVPLLEAAIYDLLKMNEALTARLEALEGA